MSSSIGVRRAALATGLVALLWMLSASLPVEHAGAHANQIRSSPTPGFELDEPPDRVIVWYSEPIEGNLSEIRVLDSQAREVDNGDSALSPSEPTAMVVTLPPLQDGAYTVVWSNVSTVDGHRVIGSFRFSVGEPLSGAGGQALPAQPLLQTEADPFLRWAFFIGALTFTGILAFDLFIVRRSISTGHGEALDTLTVRRIQSAMFRLMLAAVALMVFGLLALLVQQASVTFQVSVINVLGDPLRSVLDSEWGQQWLRRSLAVAVAGVLAILSARTVLRASSGPGSEDEDGEPVPLAFTETIPGALALAAGITALALTSFSSHNAAVPDEARFPAIITDFMHLVAASVWFGGLFYLATGAIFAMRSLSPERRAEAMNALIPRFTPVAIASAITLIATGIVSGYMQVTVPAATATPYGWALVAKLILLLPVFGLAVLNSLVISRQVFRHGLLTTFRRSIRAEAAIALLVLLAVGWMAGLEPARQYAARTGIGVSDSRDFSDFVEGADIGLSVGPGRVGQNSVTVTLRDRRGDPITNATDVRVRLKFLEDDLGEPLVSLENTGNGVWRLDSTSIAIAGVYQAELLVVRPDAFDARTSFRFDAASTSGAGDAIAPTRSVAWTLLGLQILVTGIGIVVVGMPSFRKLRVPSVAHLAPGGTLAVLGAVLILNAQVLRIGFPEDRFNPFPLTAESIEMGRGSYEDTCAACHGISGRGDGPQGSELNTPPADLHVHVPLHSDGDLFRFIRDGIPGTAMLGQQGTLTEEEMWRLVNYLRTFEE